MNSSAFPVWNSSWSAFLNKSGNILCSSAKSRPEKLKNEEMKTIAARDCNQLVGVFKFQGILREFRSEFFENFDRNSRKADEFR